MAVSVVVATFTGAEDSVTVAFSGITTNPPKIFGGMPVVSDGSTVVLSLSSPTNSGVTVNTSGRFTGTVVLVAMD
jgi:hypothetical protein